MRTALIALIVLVATTSYSQTNIWKGRVLSTSGEPLSSAVIVSNCSEDLTEVNSYGYFSMVCHLDTLFLHVSCFGFVSRKIALHRGEDYTILLHPNNLPDIVVVDQEIHRSSSVISPDFVQRLPSLFGETDVMKALSFLPGITQINELSGRVSVRGGEGDQNLVLLNGIPVLNPVHAFGLISPFNSDCFRSVSLYKDRIPSHFGNVLSSAVSIDTKKGSLDSTKVELSIGLVNSGLTIQGPLSKKRKISYMATVRGVYSGLVFLPFRIASVELPYFGVYDGMGVIDYQISSRSSMRMSMYQSRDFFGELSTSDVLTEEFKVGWGNLSGGLEYQYRFGGANLLTSTAYYSEHNNQRTESLKIENENLTFSSDRESILRNLGLRTIWATGSRKLDMKHGLELRYTDLKPSILEVVAPDGSQSSSIRQESQTYSAFSEFDWSFTPRFEINGGLRFDYQLHSNFEYGRLNPSLELVYKPTGGWDFRIGANRNHQSQFLNSLSSSGIGGDIWLGTNEVVQPMSKDQIFFKVKRGLKSNGLLEFSLFHRTYQNQVRSKESEFMGFLPDFEPNWDQNLWVDGVRRAYGLEVFLSTRIKNHSSLMTSLTLSKFEDQFDVFNNGKSFISNSDRPIVFDIEYSLRISKRWNLSARWNFASGMPITIPEKVFLDPFGQPQPIYGEVNNYRLPNYHRLDITLMKNYRNRKSGKPRQFVFSLYNAYSRLNPATFTFRRSREVRIDGQTQLVYDPQIDLNWVLPILPGIQWKVFW